MTAGKAATERKGKTAKHPEGSIAHGDFVDGDHSMLREYFSVPRGADCSKILEHFGKCVCAFRNSRTGGTIWIGVQDNGAVEGFNLKDKPGLKQKIREEMKLFEPELTDAQCTWSLLRVLKLIKNRLRISKMNTFFVWQ